MVALQVENIWIKCKMTISSIWINYRAIGQRKFSFKTSKFNRSHLTSKKFLFIFIISRYDCFMALYYTSDYKLLYGILICAKVCTRHEHACTVDKIYDRTNNVIAIARARSLLYKSNLFTVVIEIRYSHSRRVSFMTIMRLMNTYIVYIFISHWEISYFAVNAIILQVSKRRTTVSRFFSLANRAISIRNLTPRSIPRKLQFFSFLFPFSSFSLTLY